VNSIIIEDIKDVDELVDPTPFFDKTILISGGSGFLPAYLVEYFLYINQKYYNQKIDVIIIVRDIIKANNRFRNYLNNKSLMIYEHDVVNYFNYDGKIDFIIHAASQASPKYFGIDPVGTLSANTIGTNNLLKLGVEKKIKSFLFFSSSEIYGNSSEFSSINICETNYAVIDPNNVRSCYSLGKKMGENICTSWAKQYGIDVKIVRPFHTYGPGMSLEDGRVFADFVKNIVNKKNIIIKSDGKAIRSYCYIKDATIGFLKVLSNGKNNYPYNIGNPNESFSVKELAKIIIDISNISEIECLINDTQNKGGYLKSETSRLVPNIDRLTELGFVPKTSAREGFKRTILSYYEKN